MEVIKLDHQGRGLGYIDGVITFVSGALPKETVEVEIVSGGPRYNIAKLIDIKEPSSKRVNPKCKYFSSCGGCSLMNMSYDNTMRYKKEKMTDILSRYAGLSPNIEVIRSKDKYHYRNKIRIQLVNGIINYFEYDSKNLTNINYCLVAKEAINEFLGDISYLNLNNAEITIRSNYNNELVVVIETEEQNKVNIEHLKSKHKIAGIVFNKELIFGDAFFTEIIFNKIFRVSYDAFFQINNNINENIFAILDEHILPNSDVLDLYCGVGTLGINVAKWVRSVSGVEINQNAIEDALINAKMNKVANIKFFLGNVSDVIKKIPYSIDSVIVDPPRSGLISKDISTIIDINPKQIIYISCDPMTLARDLSVLKDKYEIEKFYLLDMFPYTYHVENMCILKKK